MNGDDFDALKTYVKDRPLRKTKKYAKTKKPKFKVQYAVLVYRHGTTAIEGLFYTLAYARECMKDLSNASGVWTQIVRLEVLSED